MRRLILLTSLTILLVAAAPGAAMDLAERLLLDGRVAMLVPEDFELMGEEMMRLKYPSERRPTVVLTNPRGSVNVALNHTQDALPAAEIEQVHEFMDNMFRNVYPSASWNRSEVTSREGRQFFLLDLVTPAVDTKIRNMITGTSVDGRLLLVTFNCTQELEEEWAALGRKIIESIRVIEPEP